MTRRAREKRAAPVADSAPAWARWTTLVPLVALYLAFGAFQVYDYDVPLHLVTGRALLEDPSSFGRNVFSFSHPDYPWLNDKWLENVLVHLVHATAGAPGLVVLRMALLLALLWIARAAMQGGGGEDRPQTAVAVAAALVVLPLAAYERFTLRPELFSIVLLAATLALLLRDRRTRGEWVAVGLLHVLWVNLHVYWILGPVVIATFLAGDLVERWTAPIGWPEGAEADAASDRARFRWKMLAAALAGALMSPSPLGLFLNPWRTFLFARGQESMGTIAELRSPFDPEARFQIALGFFFAMSVAALLILLLRPRRLRPAHALVLIELFVLAALMRRAVGMFAVAAAVICVRQLAGAFPAPARDEEGEAAPARQPPVVAAVLAVLGILSLGAAGFVATDRLYHLDGSARRTGFTFSRLTFPTGMADFLVAERPPGQFFNDFTSGSYLAFRLYPERRVFITGNTFKYPPEFLDEYFAVTEERLEYAESAARWGLDGFALFYASPEVMPLALKLLRDRAYAPLYFDDDSLFFLRRSPETQGFIERLQVNFSTVAEQRASETVVPETGSFLRPPEFPRGEMNRATLLHRVRALPLAEVEYRRALRRRPDLQIARHGLADVVLGQGRAEEALEMMAPLLQDRPDDPHLLRDVVHADSSLGSKAAAAGDWELAQRHLETALSTLGTARALDPAGPRLESVESATRFNLAWVLYQQEETASDAARAARIESEIELAMLSAPDDAALRYRIARLRMRQGRTEEALALLREALAGDEGQLGQEARMDPAFAPLHGDPEFRRLVTPADGGR